MDWNRLAGYGFYVWAAYAVFALALVLELFGLRQSRRGTEETLREEALLAELARRERGAAPGSRP